MMHLLEEGHIWQYEDIHANVCIQALASDAQQGSAVGFVQEMSWTFPRWYVYQYIRIHMNIYENVCIQAPAAVAKQCSAVGFDGGDEFYILKMICVWIYMSTYEYIWICMHTGIGLCCAARLSSWVCSLKWVWHSQDYMRMNMYEYIWKYICIYMHTGTSRCCTAWLSSWVWWRRWVKLF